MNNYYEFDGTYKTPVPPAESGREYLTSKISEFTSNLVISSKFYKDLLRSLLSQININYINDKQDRVNVKIHHGRQERAIAKKFQENNIILPYSTIFQSKVEEDTKKRRNSGRLP